MVRGDEYGNFTAEEAAEWTEPPQRPQAHGPRHRRADLGFGESIGWGVIGSVVLIALFTLSERSPQSRPETPAVTASAPAVNRQVPAPPMQNAYVYDAGGYHAEIFLDGSPTVRFRGTLPPDVTLTRFVTEVPLYYQPYDIGLITATAPANTIFIHSKSVLREPCWRWVQSLDRIYSGYVCFASETGSPAPNNSTNYFSNASAAAATQEKPPSSPVLDAQYLARIREALELVNSEKSSHLFEEMTLPGEEAEAWMVFDELARQLDKSHTEFLEQLRDSRQKSRSRVVNTK